MDGFAVAATRNGDATTQIRPERHPVGMMCDVSRVKPRVNERELSVALRRAANVLQSWRHAERLVLALGVVGKD